MGTGVVQCISQYWTSPIVSIMINNNVDFKYKNNFKSDDGAPTDSQLNYIKLPGPI